jgi:protein SCO1/2
MNFRHLRIASWTLLAIVALAGVGAYTLRQTATGNEAVVSRASFGGGEYALETSAGQPFTPASLSGGPSMLFFGYTHCPDVCPTTLAEMAAWYDELGAQGKSLRAFFVTVDPERDTPAIINDYAHAVSDRITGVTGAPDQIAAMEKAWGVYAKKVPTQDGDYSMDHTATIYLLDSRGELESTIVYGEDGDTALTKLKHLIARG